MKNFILIIIFSFVTFNIYALEVTLTQGTIKPTPIAITDMFSENNKAYKVGKNISMVISDNLETKVSAFIYVPGIRLRISLIEIRSSSASLLL